MITPSTLVSHIEWLSQARILCVGDLMLDRFVYGEVERTSPEAPVPILGIERQSVMLGGVGNVARNLISIGAHAALLSVVGDDEVGRRRAAARGQRVRGPAHAIRVDCLMARVDVAEDARSPAAERLLDGRRPGPDTCLRIQPRFSLRAHGSVRLVSLRRRQLLREDPRLPHVLWGVPSPWIKGEVRALRGKNIQNVWALIPANI